MTVGSLFSGIGGLDLGLERAGMRVIWQCESDAYCRAVLRKHWPRVPCYEDVRAIDGSVPRVDLICGGFPCQPVSIAGRRRGKADQRWLWPEFGRVLRILRPRFAVVENTPGLYSLGLGDVLGDLAALGYDAEWDGLPAGAFGSPQIRDRIFVVAYTRHDRTTERRECEASASPDPSGSHLRCGSGVDTGQVAVGKTGQDSRIFPNSPSRLQRQLRWCSREDDGETQWHLYWTTGESPTPRVAHGVPSRLDRARALGNAVVPQVAEWIGRRIMEADERRLA